MTQNLLAHNLSSYGFWTLIDKQKAGYLSFPEFLQVLRMVRFQGIVNPDDFKKEFPTVVKTHPYLLQDKNNDAVPLSAFSHLFLERNL